jgi:CRP-like cAMP-binding protein
MATLGKDYADREVIVKQGDPGDCMYVVQEGQVEAIAESDGREMRLRVMGPNDFFGEMALFGTEKRSCTIRALGKARVMTIDKKSFLGGIQEDPSLAFRIVKVMSQRIRDLTDRLTEFEMKR